MQLNVGQVFDFLCLTQNQLRELTFGTYQVKLSPFYVLDKLERNADDFQVDLLMDNPGFMSVRVH